MFCVWVLLQAEGGENADSMLIGEDEYAAASAKNAQHFCFEQA